MKSYQLYLIFIELILAVVLKGFTQLNCKGAHLSNILTCYPHSITHAGNQPEDVIVLNYKNITWKHHIASTESYSCWEERIF
ncbi:Secreted protein hcp [Escherichia coli]|uniref:Secreted protein hcp n=1 Tax=Escherichia coli TaxID=562 RepID=A0A484YSZ3_ECOLX|nr:Secreted protein hcp [Escherichia coli]